MSAWFRLLEAADKFIHWAEPYAIAKRPGWALLIHCQYHICNAYERALTGEDDMTREEFDRLLANSEPVQVVIPEGGIIRSRPNTYGSGVSYNFTWSPEGGLQERS